MGRLTADPELRRTTNGTAVASFTLAVERDGKPGEDGKRPTDFIDCVAWRGTGEFVSKWFSKGRMAVAEGRMQTRTWKDKHDQSRKTTELVIDNIDCDAALISVQENRADVMLAGLTYNEDRDLVMDFTDPYATGVQVIIVREGDTTIAGTNDDLQLVDADGNVLEDIQIGVQRGTTGELYCQDAHGVDHVTSLDNGSVAVQALLNGQVDCVVIDNGPAQSYVEATPGLEILEGAYVVEDYCAAVDQGNEALLTAVNTALNELIEDGTVQSIMDKYITAE